MATYGTTDRCTGGTASASTEADIYVAANAFDNNAISTWAATATTGWIKYDCGAGVSWRIGQIKITNNSDSKAFTLYGSNNDSDWTSIGSGQSDQDAGTDTFSFSNTKAYRYMRVSVTSSWAGNIGYKEIEMFEDLTPLAGGGLGIGNPYIF